MDYLSRYQWASQTRSDINEHIPTLYEYAKQCQHVTECGVRAVVSTWAFIKGLVDNGSTTKRLIGVDLNYHSNIKMVEDAAKQCGIDYKFIEGNDVVAELEPTDLLFIDTWHVYGHLKRELAAHCDKVNKFIIMHDTTVDEFVGESIRERFDILKQVKETGYPIEEITKGLWPAVDEFLIEHKEWVLHERFTNNNGLTVLRRCDTPVASDSAPASASV